EKYGHVINPATNESIVEVPLSGKDSVDAAVEAATKAQKEWALVPAPMRAEVLFKIGSLMKERKERLAQLLTMENGKVIEEGRGEVQEGIDMAFYMAGEGRRLFGQTTPAELYNKFAMSVRAPIGVAGMIISLHLSMVIASWKSGYGIIADNAIVLKLATLSPIIFYEMMKIYDDAGLPKGVINVVFGTGSDVRHAMVHHDGIKFISS